MKLKKTIDILETWSATGEFIDQSEFAQAVRLGIEALKFRQLVKKAGHIRADSLLPGETLD